MKIIDVVTEDNVIEKLLRSGWKREPEDEKYFIQ